MLFRNDFSVIALIGIILLIGIVKKNAIMMIDFALEAERKEHMPPRRRFIRLSAEVPAIMMTTMAALLAASRWQWARHRLRIAPSAGYLDRRGLLVSQLLTLYTTPWCTCGSTGWRGASAVRPPASRWCRCLPRSVHEPLDTLHLPACRHGAADHCAGWPAQWPINTCPFPRCRSGVSDYLGRRRPAGRQPETMASAVATPLERQFGRIARSRR